MNVLLRWLLGGANLSRQRRLERFAVLMTSSAICHKGENGQLSIGGFDGAAEVYTRDLDGMDWGRHLQNPPYPAHLYHNQRVLQGNQIAANLLGADVLTYCSEDGASIAWKLCKGHGAGVNNVYPGIGAAMLVMRGMSGSFAHNSMSSGGERVTARELPQGIPVLATASMVQINQLSHRWTWLVLTKLNGHFGTKRAKPPKSCGGIIAPMVLSPPAPIRPSL